MLQEKMKYYIDTQTVAQVIFKKDDMSRPVRQLFEDYSNRFYTSSVCIKELVHLIQNGRIRPMHKRDRYEACKVIETVLLAGVDVVCVSVPHLEQMATLPVMDDHNDPDDRLIIAQAIHDRVPLISTDLKFRQYIPHGLTLIENR